MCGDLCNCHSVAKTIYRCLKRVRVQIGCAHIRKGFETLDNFRCMLHGSVGVYCVNVVLESIILPREIETYIEYP